MTLPSWSVGLRLTLLAGIALLLFLPGFTAIPVIDRDEALFAQTSRQMLQSGDLITPRFHDEPRYKKPIGIYWLQTAALHVTGQGLEAGIWVYRLPSLLGAVLAVVLVAVVGTPLVGRDLAALAALLFAVCLVIGGEARLAKTDAVLLSSILIAQGALARLWLGKGGRGSALLFWLAMAAAILVKGPIGPLLSGLTAATLVIWDRRADWLSPLWSALPILIAALIVGPWLVAITLQSGGAFLSASIGGDLLAKVASGQNGIGTPPGTHLLFTALGFWPGLSLLLLSLPTIWASRTTRETRFLLAWVVPFWLLYEAVPTKLLHYLLPVYPALALLAMRQFAPPAVRPGILLKTAAAFALLPGLALGVGLAVIAARGGAAPSVVVGLAAAVAVSAAVLLYGIWQGSTPPHQGRLVLSLICAGGILNSAFFLSLARIPQLWPTEAAVQLFRDMAQRQGCTSVNLTSFGYAEPSLIFRMGAETRLLTSSSPVKAALRSGPCVAALRAVTPKMPPPQAPAGCSELGTVSGFAIGAGRWVVLQALECRGER